MKRTKGLIILVVLFALYMIQGGILLINGNDNGDNLNTNEDLLQENNERIYDIDVEEVLNSINSIGLNIDTLKKENDKVSINAFANSSKDDILLSLEKLKNSKCLIETYNITKYDNVDVRFNLKMP